jgi:branched-chain amino acid aminotransferase
MSSKPSFQKAFFKNDIVDIDLAKISIMSRVVQYGMGWFGGVRGYMSADGKRINIFRLRDHIDRFLNSAKILGVTVSHDQGEIEKIFVDLVTANKPNTDTYFRPFAFSDVTDITPNFMQDTPFVFALYMLPLGDYIATDKGNSACVSTWRRLSDNAIPSRAKVSGAYVNSSLAKQEAVINGFAEAVELDESGHVTEGTAMNLFIVRDGILVTPSASSDILEGITRKTIIKIAKDMGIETSEREVDRTELYVADEAFFCGTGAQIAWIDTIDRRLVGDGRMGIVTSKIRKVFFDLVRGNVDRYMSWLTTIEV